MLIDLAAEIGLCPKRTSSTHGGEFHSACPRCGGTDRFIIWPNLDRYWCRQCKVAGDAISFCREFMNMSFRDAKTRVNGMEVPPLDHEKVETENLSKSWNGKAEEFVDGCHQRLVIDQNMANLIGERGLSSDTICRYKLGWNPVTSYVRRQEWGLDRKVEQGVEKKLWIPAGIVIPTFDRQSLKKIKIRRHEWYEGDRYGKYYILPGSIDLMPIYGDQSNDVVVVVEAELDAMLVAQEAESLGCCMALGGAQKRPSAADHQWLLQKKTILLALDFDEAGKKEYPYWHAAFPNLCLWPVPVGKSPAEAWRLGINLKSWIGAGLKQALK
jgi:DNA primase